MRAWTTRPSWRHYAEMVGVMLVGMAVLIMPLRLVVDGDDPSLMLARMGVAMTVPMIPWMRRRGHGWAPTLEMAGAMIVPTLAAIGLHQAGATGDVGLLMTVEHTAMFVAMFAVMAARPHEYAHHHASRAATASA